MLIPLTAQVDNINANSEDQDSMLKDMLSTLIKHLF